MKNILLLSIIILITQYSYSQKDYCGFTRRQIYEENYKLYPFDNAMSFDTKKGTIVFVDMEDKIVKSFDTDENGVCYKSTFLYFDLRMFETLKNYMKNSKNYREEYCDTKVCNFVFLNTSNKDLTFIILQKGDNEVVLTSTIIK